MSMEVLDSICAAEAQAKASVAAAEQQAKQMLAEAESAGKAAVAAAGVKAEAELRELSAQTEEKAREEALALANELENKKATLKARGEARLEKAAALVVERIVNS